MTTEQKTQFIIGKAIEGGWRPTFLTLPHLHKHRCLEQALLDPKFWQALGKAMGWDIDKCLHENPEASDNGICDSCAIKAYRKRWYKLIDHLIEKKSAESYSEELKNFVYEILKDD